MNQFGTVIFLSITEDKYTIISVSYYPIILSYHINEMSSLNLCKSNYSLRFSLSQEVCLRYGTTE